MKLSARKSLPASIKEAIVWARGDDVPVRVTVVRVPPSDVRAIRRKLGLS
jgi:hypothetical protein